MKLRKYNRPHNARMFDEEIDSYRLDKRERGKRLHEKHLKNALRARNTQQLLEWDDDAELHS